MIMNVTQQRSAETRAQIIATARNLFAQNGYEATGVAEICTEAGLSKGAFYHHFPSKQDVFLAILQEWMQELDRQMVKITQGAKDVPSSLLTMAGMTGLVFQAASGQLPMFLEFWSQASRDEAVWKETIAPYREYHQQFAELIRQGIREGTIKEVNPESAAWAILAMAVGMVLQGVLDPQSVNWGQVTKEGIHFLLEGLKKHE